MPNQTSCSIESQPDQVIWNVHHLTELFSCIKRKLDECMNLIAERVKFLSSVARPAITISGVAQVSNMSEYSLEIASAKDCVITLANHLTSYGIVLRNQSSAFNINLYTEISDAIDKYIRVLESHLINLWMLESQSKRLDLCL
jgi:DNA-binding ferritin-like protein